MRDHEDTFFALHVFDPLETNHFIIKFFFAIFEKIGERKSYLDQEPVSRSPAKAFKPWLGLDTNHAFRYPVERTYFRALGPQLFERQLALARG